MLMIFLVKRGEVQAGALQAEELGIRVDRDDQVRHL